MTTKISETMGAGDLAKLLGIGPRYLQQLAADGVLPAPVSRGQYDAAGCIMGFVEHLRRESRESTKSAGADRVAAARAREIELRVAKAEGRVCDIDEAYDTLDAIIGFVVQGLSSLPARVSRDPLVQQRVQAECDRISNEMAAEAKRQEAKAGRP